jgi:EF-P beta-lysylation protein EpmB
MSLPILSNEQTKTDSSSNSIPAWKRILRKNFTKINELIDFLELNQEQKECVEKKAKFALNVPLRFAEKMKKSTLDDPLVRQFLPSINESSLEPGFEVDPVGDSCAQVSSKLLHKYQGRVLLLTTGACAVHCRYCFRQNFNYEAENKSFHEEIAMIAADPSIHEVILSGGDPLSLSESVLEPLLNSLDGLDHIKRIRFHTRLPIGIPERINAPFLAMISKLKKQIWFIVHVNHPLELDQDVLLSLKSLQKLGCIVLNQSVLLQGVNDDLATLRELCELLVDNGILPYYLHQLDRVKGSRHFEVEEERGRTLIQELSKVLPGYAIPKYVREIAGEPGKTPILEGLKPE